MKIYHVEFAKTGTVLSGGEKCMLEVIKYLKSRSIKNVLLTTDNGKRMYQKLGLTEDEFLTYVTIDTGWSEKRLHVFMSYMWRPFLFLRIKSQILSTINSTEDVLICHSDFFPNKE